MIQKKERGGGGGGADRSVSNNQFSIVSREKATEARESIL